MVDTRQGILFTEFTFKNFEKMLFLVDKQGQRSPIIYSTTNQKFPRQKFVLYSNTNQKFPRQKSVSTGHMKFLVKGKFN